MIIYNSASKLEPRRPEVLKESLSLAEDMTQFTLIYANRAEEDILLREELQELAAQSGGRISVHYVPRALIDWNNGSNEDH